MQVLSGPDVQPLTVCKKATAEQEEKTATKKIPHNSNLPCINKRLWDYDIYKKQILQDSFAAMIKKGWQSQIQTLQQAGAVITEDIEVSLQAAFKEAISKGWLTRYQRLKEDGAVVTEDVQFIVQSAFKEAITKGWSGRYQPLQELGAVVTEDIKRTLQTSLKAAILTCQLTRAEGLLMIGATITEEIRAALQVTLGAMIRNHWSSQYGPLAELGAQITDDLQGTLNSQMAGAIRRHDWPVIDNILFGTAREFSPEIEAELDSEIIKAGMKKYLEARYSVKQRGASQTAKQVAVSGQGSKWFWSANGAYFSGHCAYHCLDYIPSGAVWRKGHWT